MRSPTDRAWMKERNGDMGSCRVKTALRWMKTINTALIWALLFEVAVGLVVFVAAGLGLIN